MSKPSTIKRLRELYEESTQGEWRTDTVHTDDVFYLQDRVEPKNSFVVRSEKSDGIGKLSVCNGGYWKEDWQDAQFIVEAHNHMPALLDALEKAMEELYVIGAKPLSEKLDYKTEFESRQKLANQALQEINSQLDS